jgi:hypothetical protein
MFYFILFYLFIYLHCYISISSLYGVTLWKLIFPILVLHQILVVTFVCTVIIAHGSFPFSTLLCRVYRPYGLIFCQQLYNHSFTAICLAKPLVCSLPVSYEWDIEVLLYLVRLLIFMVCFANSPCCIVDECINVGRFN